MKSEKGLAVNNLADKVKPELRLPDDIKLLEPNPECLKAGHLCAMQEMFGNKRRICLTPSTETIESNGIVYTETFKIRACSKSGNSKGLIF
jgi:hypothetical protein